MAFSELGRHRATGTKNVLSALGNLDSVAKSSAVLAVSGGLVAAFSLPSQGANVAAAKPADQAAKTVSNAALAAQPAFTAPKAKSDAKNTAERLGANDLVAVAKGPSKAQLRAAAAARRAAEARANEARTAAATTTASESRSTGSSVAASRSASRTTTNNYPTAPSTTGGVIGIARQYSGLPYLYGGTSPSTGFDCSGFTSYVFRQVGISLPRTAEQQRQATTPVSNPQPGDLVFFGAPAYHVGIYVGNGMMIDSPRTGSVISVRSIWNRGGAQYHRAG